MAAARTMGGITGTAVLAGAILLALLWFFQRRLIYLPVTGAVPPAGEVLPGSEEVTFETGDGLTLNGWFLPAADGAAAVLVFNGNAGNRSFRVPLARALAEAGLSVLLFDYRGYGDNPGMPSEAGLLADARAARRWLAARPEVDPGRIVYFGESLGGAVAVGLAAEAPPAAIILRSPFTSLPDVARLHYPFLPVGLLLRDRYPSLERIGGLPAPLLVIAGERDSIVPADQSRRLFDAAAGPKEFVLLPGAEHNDFELLAGDALIEEVVGFLEERRI